MMSQDDSKWASSWVDVCRIPEGAWEEENTGGSWQGKLGSPKPVSHSNYGTEYLQRIANHVKTIIGNRHQPFGL
jgi:hypothetical protein